MQTSAQPPCTGNVTSSATATPLFALDEWLRQQPEAQITFYPCGKRFGDSHTFASSSVIISRNSSEAHCPGQLSIGLDIASVDAGPNNITALDSWGDIVVEATSPMQTPA